MKKVFMATATVGMLAFTSMAGVSIYQSITYHNGVVTTVADQQRPKGHFVQQVLDDGSVAMVWKIDDGGGGM